MEADVDNGKHVVRVATLGDPHCGPITQGLLAPLFAQAAAAADVLILCGDLTDHGLPEEARMLVQELAGAKLPVLAVLGNHDYESGHVEEVRRIILEAGVVLLDGEAREVLGVGFAGAKGFGGGFGRGTLASFGEPMVKRFVQEAMDEAIKLEGALARLRTRHRIAVLHYAPVSDTVQGEPPEIYPYLGCSRLEEPINGFQVTAVVHGHAHRGAPEGRTSTGTPVYNVSIPVMRAAFPDRPPFRLLTIQVAESAPPVEQPTAAPVETEVG